MAKKNSTHKKYILITLSILLILFLSISFLVMKDNSKKSSIVKTQELVPGSTSYITPTIVPSVNRNKIIFNHPQNHFSFEYQKEWHLELTRKEVSEPYYYVILNDHPNYDNARIHFMNDARGAPYFEYETNEIKTINGRKINWNLMYINNKAFEAYVSFPDKNFANNLFGLYIYLPENNQEEFIKQVEDIIASLK